MFTGLSFSEIARHVAREGVYEYAKSVVTSSAGFVGGCMWTFGNIIGISAVSISFGSYLDRLFGLHYDPVILAILCIITFMALNIVGIKNSAKTITVLVIINVAVLVIFIFSGITRFHSGNFSDFIPHGYSGIITGTALIFFAFTGFSRVTTISDEVINPEKTLPFAIIISINNILCALYYGCTRPSWIKAIL
ncbi:amino acid permease [Picrophilus oshimae DSM 9789]|uniref:Amino acid permease n=1 Tax=Picrophilus torridus (strain ATCC 700027 / DSM 9790 / JCM 10055 / NBRC 100828 / KAW 2/3) TaxID=1122961 RepID=Q6L329_PICTO|nr:amino acid permease [Picrophilus oshimae DSM 9789]